jgi:inosine/xanthosine triphosphatase
MKKIIIASRNKTKIQAVKDGFAKMFPDKEFEFIGISVPSCVPNQPRSDSETFLGAKNRADNAFEEIKDAEFYVGIEGGIELIKDEMESFAWIVIRSADRYGKAKTGTFFLPKKIIRLIEEGKELGEADDIVFDRKDSKLENGAVGLLTGDVIHRTRYYTEAVVLALIPFRNVDLY